MQYFSGNSSSTQSSTPIIAHADYQPGMWYLPVSHPNFVQTGQAEIAHVTMEYSSGDKVEIINRDKYTIPCRLATDPVEADGRICPRCKCHGLVRKDGTSIKLKDLTIGSSMTVLDVARMLDFIIVTSLNLLWLSNAHILLC